MNWTGMTSVSVVVPTFQRPRVLQATLASLMAVRFPADKLELIVVDDADDRATKDVIAAVCGDCEVTLLRQQRRGAATARNAGAAAAQGELLLFLDDDMLVAPEHLGQHVSTHQEFAPAMVGSWRWYSPAALATLAATPFGRYRIALERRFMDELDEPPLGGDCFAATLLAANDMSLPRAAFEELGGFDEAYPHAGAEDQDLSIRARALGLQLVRNKAIQPEHEEDIVTLQKFAWREERGGETVVVLGQRFPEAVGDFTQNGPIDSGDPPAVIVKKLVKTTLDRSAPLAALHALARLLERLRAPERLLHRVYSTIIALHIHRGYRRALVTRV